RRRKQCRELDRSLHRLLWKNPFPFTYCAGSRPSVEPETPRSLSPLSAAPSVSKRSNFTQRRKGYAKAQRGDNFFFAHFVPLREKSLSQPCKGRCSSYRATQKGRG